jgi:hypothetical protein
MEQPEERVQHGTVNAISTNHDARLDKYRVGSCIDYSIVPLQENKMPTVLIIVASCLKERIDKSRDAHQPVPADAHGVVGTF